MASLIVGTWRSCPQTDGLRTCAVTGCHALNLVNTVSGWLDEPEGWIPDAESMLILAEYGAELKFTLLLVNCSFQTVGIYKELACPVGILELRVVSRNRKTAFYRATG